MEKSNDRERHPYGQPRHPKQEPTGATGSAQTKRRPFEVAFETSCKRFLDPFYVLGLPPFRALDYVELDLLTFLQAAESIGLNGREVHEHVLAVLAANKSITLGVVKPLYCSCFHGIAMFLCVEIALRLLDFCRQVTPRSPDRAWRGGIAGVACCKVPLKSNALTLYLILSTHGQWKVPSGGGRNASPAKKPAFFRGKPIVSRAGRPPHAFT